MSDDNHPFNNQQGRAMGPPKLTLVSQSGGQIAKADSERVSNEFQSDDTALMAQENAQGAPVSIFAASDHGEELRVIEALLFAAPNPMSVEELAAYLRQGDNVAACLDELQKIYEVRGINLVHIAGKWTFRTAQDLSHLLQSFKVETRRLSKAALETLAIIAYHQPVTRAEIEEIRGVTTSVGTLDILLETGWARLRGRRRAPGRPVTYGTTDAFLNHFSLESIKDLPGLAELRGAGLLDSSLPANFQMPQPTDIAALMPDELPLEDEVEDEVEDNEDNEVQACDDERQDEVAKFEEDGRPDKDERNGDLPNTPGLDKPETENAE